MNPWVLIRRATAGAHARLQAALGDPQRAQHRQLVAILTANRDTVWGRRYGFAAIGDADDYRRRVPIHRYEDLAPDIDRMLAGESHRLTAAPVVCYQETGGSSGGAKIIPYTGAALAAFHAAVHPWLHDLAAHRPGLAAGRSYWALSPALQPLRRAADGTPMGLEDDAAYFGPDLDAAVRALSIVPPTVGRTPDLERWRYLTLRYLLEAEDLTLISVWSPTFLTVLLEGLAIHGSDLVRDLAQGTVTPPGGAPAGGFARRLKRAAVVAHALSAARPDTFALWPRLDTLSCWTSSASARFVPALRRAFPHAFVQGKGLLATEGVVSLPLVGVLHPVLALHSGFFELLDESGTSHLAHEVEEGREYQVVMTTPGGLYRYALGDRVGVRGWHGATPQVEFVGRADACSDLCGEKLDEAQVQAALPGGEGFAMLAPASGERPHYVLFLDAAERDAAAAAALAEILDGRLRRNPQYDYARRLGQLGPIRPCCLADARGRYLQVRGAAGQRLGDIKPALLRGELDWEQRLCSAPTNEGPS